MPKLYFQDVGLAAALLGIQTVEQVAAHPLRGALFETMVVNEFLKARRNAGRRDQLYFWRDNIGTEIDLVLEQGQALNPARASPVMPLCHCANGRNMPAQCKQISGWFMAAQKPMNAKALRCCHGWTCRCCVRWCVR